MGQAVRQYVGVVFSAALLVGMGAFGQGADSIVNFETPHVSPIAISPDGTILAVCNTPDNRVELYDLTGELPETVGSISVGYDPVSVRFRSNTELWVVNQVSDSVSIVDLNAATVVFTIDTRVPPQGAFPLSQIPRDFGDEPADVVFAGDPQMAYITCSQSNRVVVVDPNNPAGGLVDQIEIFGEDPRMMTVSPDGSTVYVAIFESGNGTTALGGSQINFVSDILPNVVSDTGPYGGVNPPPNVGGVSGTISPPVNQANPPPLRMGLIVRNTDDDRWLDDNGGDWTQWVSGANAADSGRVPGWDLPDNDIAMIDTATNGVSYIQRIMNICMAIGMNPATGAVTMVGTEALNEVRFEPNVNGVFLRVNLALIGGSGDPTIVDLNSHLDYQNRIISQNQRDLSIGDPRAIVWNDTGTQGYITGLGSNNVIVVDATGARIGTPIEVGEGPTGLAMDAARGRVYVLNKFAASISTIDTESNTEIDRLAFFDPTPSAIRVGRKHLYDTHKNSGLGHVSCASCHVDARMDRLAWDLGEPGGEMKTVTDQNLFFGIPLGGFLDFHPMKGPMTTQTLQDIIGKEPLHWRGDRRGLEEFNPAFVGLQSDDTMLTGQEMQEYKDFLASIHFPPNPYRNLDNTLPTNVFIPDQFSTGELGGGSQRGDRLPNGDAVRGLRLYMGTEQRAPFPSTFDSPFNCVTCHTLPLGAGGDSLFNFSTFGFTPFPTDAMGNHHSALVSTDGSTNRSIKVPHLRNDYEKVGMDLTNQASRAGFGFFHDGSVDTLATFFSSSAFDAANDQDIADIVALMLAFSGSDFGDPPQNPPDFGGDLPLVQEPMSFQTSKDAHAAVGKQITIDSDAARVLLGELIAFSIEGEIDLVAKTNIEGVETGFLHIGGSDLQMDDDATIVSFDFLRSIASPSNPVTFTAVPRGSGARLGIDRDLDGFGDGCERNAGTDPADRMSVPDSCGQTMEGEGEGEGESEGAGEGEGETEGAGEGEGESEGAGEGEGEAEGGGEGQGEPLVTIMPRNPRVAVGETLQLTAMRSVPGVTRFRWSSDNIDIAEVDQVTGLVSGVAEGQTIIRVVDLNSENAGSIMLRVIAGSGEGMGEGGGEGEGEGDHSIDECGQLSVASGGCPQFHSDAGNTYRLQNLGGFPVGQRVRIVGMVIACSDPCNADACIVDIELMTLCGAQGEGEGETEGLGEGEGEPEGDGEGEGEGETEGVAEGEGEGEPEGAAEGEGEGESEGVAEGEGEGEPEGATEGEGEGEGEGETEIEMIQRVLLSNFARLDVNANGSLSLLESRVQFPALSQFDFNNLDANSSGGLNRGELGGADPEGEGESEGQPEGNGEGQSEGGGEGQSEGDGEGQTEGEGDGEGTMCAAGGAKTGAPGAIPPDWILLALTTVLLYRKRNTFSKTAGQ